MKNNNKWIYLVSLTVSLFFVALLFSFTLSNQALAHPGNTDSSGCHTCRTNCSSWGLSYGEYHCHNNRGTPQPSYPIHSIYGEGGTGYTTPAPDYAYPSIPTTPTCPSMSSYDSISGSCKCWSGYVVDTDFLGNQTCVSGNTKCSKDYGYGAEYDSLSKICKCRYGYVMSGGQCVNGDTLCHNQLDYHSDYNSLSDKCECDSGYIIEGGKCISRDDSCQNQLGYSSQYNILSNVCECKSGYVIDGGKCAEANSVCREQSGSFSRYNTASNKCECISGYIYDAPSKKCISNEDYCVNQLGSHAKYDDSSDKCVCKSGYVENSSGDKCTDGGEYCRSLFGGNSDFNYVFERCECNSGYETVNNRCKKIEAAIPQYQAINNPQNIVPNIPKTKENNQIGQVLKATENKAGTDLKEVKNNQDNIVQRKEAAENNKPRPSFLQKFTNFFKGLFNK